MVSEFLDFCWKFHCRWRNHHRNHHQSVSSGMRYVQCIATKILLLSDFRRIGSWAGALILRNSSSFLSTILLLHLTVSSEVIILHYLPSSMGPTTTWQVHLMGDLDCSENPWSQATTHLHHLTTKY